MYSSVIGTGWTDCGPVKQSSDTSRSPYEMPVIAHQTCTGCRKRNFTAPYVIQQQSLIEHVAAMHSRCSCKLLRPGDKAQIPLRRLRRNFPGRESFGEVGVMEFGLKGDVTGLSQTCRGRHGEVGIVEYGLKPRHKCACGMRRRAGRIGHKIKTGALTHTDCGENNDLRENERRSGTSVYYQAKC